MIRPSRFDRIHRAGRKSIAPPEFASIRVVYPDLALALYATGFSDYYLPKLPAPRMVLHQAITQWNKNIGGSFYARQIDF
jgi:hypothetical protein